jgi:hypothetical protein
MELRRETLAAIADDVAHVPIDNAILDQQVAALAPLLAEIDRLRDLTLKDCEPRLVFLPVED